MVWSLEFPPRKYFPLNSAEIIFTTFANSFLTTSSKMEPLFPKILQKLYLLSPIVFLLPVPRWNRCCTAVLHCVGISYVSFLLSLILSYLLMVHWDSFTITETRLYNFDPLKPHFYIVKLEFTGVYIIFLISAQKHRLWVLVRTASPRRS